MKKKSTEITEGKTIVIEKGCKDGYDYIRIFVDGEGPFEPSSDLSRKLTGATQEFHQEGIFSTELPKDLWFCYGTKKISLSSFEGMTRLFSNDTAKEYAEEINRRITALKRWVGKHDYESTATFSV